jgi:DnaK suppressor protein
VKGASDKAVVVEKPVAEKPERTKPTTAKVDTPSSPGAGVAKVDAAAKADTAKIAAVKAENDRAERGRGDEATGAGRTATAVATKEAGRPEPKPKGGADVGPYATDSKFLAEQQVLLDHERAVYQGQAADLKAEADSLAQEREPGDVQFDEESGEGGTVTVDRERDLALSAQALAAVEEIDQATLRIRDKTYGACERCHQPIPKSRLRALPYARLCVACKSGGLSRR